MREQRRLAAILAADVVGYSRLMGRDESGTVACLREHRKQRLGPTLARHGGRLVKLTGDGALVEFPSAVGALSAAIEFQQAMAEANRDQPEDTRIVFRIGLHLGDLIVDGDDLYGDGVNVAARLEAEAPAGGIVISGDVHNAVTGRLKAIFDDLGSLSLKNIERPVQAFGVKWDQTDWKVAVSTPSVIATPLPAEAPLALPDKPSIAVLPFQNMSGDPEQEYFVDGLVEDITTALSRVPVFFVIARNSAFTYKGRAVDVRQVGLELGVRYVLEGSVRKAGNRLRITGQLVDASTGAHVWADRYDGALEDVFDLQDRITSSVAAAIEPSLQLAEIRKINPRATTNLTAYDLYLRAYSAIFVLTESANDECLELLDRALAADPGLTWAYGLMVWCRATRIAQRWGDLRETLERGEATARLALEKAKDDPYVLSGAAVIFTYRDGDLAEAQALVERALVLNPNLMIAWNGAGWVYLWKGEYERSAECFTRAMRLNPIDLRGYGALAGMAFVHFFTGRHEEAISWANKSLALESAFIPALIAKIAAAQLAGRVEECEEARHRLLSRSPDFGLQKVLLRHPGQERLYAALRQAGLHG